MSDSALDQVLKAFNLCEPVTLISRDELAGRLDAVNKAKGEGYMGYLREQQRSIESSLTTWYSDRLGHAVQLPSKPGTVSVSFMDKLNNIPLSETQVMEA